MPQGVREVSAWRDLSATPREGQMQDLYGEWIRINNDFRASD